MRPSHLHLMVQAPGYHKLVTALYTEGDDFLASDAVFGVRKSLVLVSSFATLGQSDADIIYLQKYQDVNDDAEARRRGFPKGGSFKFLRFDIVLATEREYKAARARST